MHSVLIINSILEWLCGGALAVLIVLWVFEIKLTPK
jgi:hypothetical protein